MSEQRCGTRRTAATLRAVAELLTVVFVALLGVLVGAVGVSAFRISENLRAREAQVEVIEHILPGTVQSILTAVPGEAIVVDGADHVMRADTSAYAKGLVRDGELASEDVRKLAAKARRKGRTMTKDLRLPRSTIAGAGTLDFRVRAAPLPGDTVLILAEDRTQQLRNEAARRDFTANVSHELKTPIGAIGLLSETIAHDPSDSETVARFAPKLVTESQRLTELVQDIIDLSRLETPDALGSASRVPIDEVIAKALAGEQTAADQSGIELEGPSGPVDAAVWGDRRQLVTAVRNLVDNAVRHSDAGTKVRVSATANSSKVSVAVTDSGPGIPAEEQQRIFERFYRVDEARDRQTGGTGLGLSIVKHIAADHGGTITVESVVDRGSTFTLVLPVADTGEED